MLEYKILELATASQPISSLDCYDPCPISISGSDSLVLAEERTHSRAYEQQSTCVPVQNIDEDEEEEDWYLDVEDDDIQNAININMDEIKDEKILKK
jgi:hypothetical protein